MKYIIKDLNNKNFDIDKRPTYINQDGLVTYNKNEAHVWSDDVAFILVKDYNKYCDKDKHGDFWILVDELPDDKYIPQPGDIFIEENNNDTKHLRFITIKICELFDEHIPDDLICCGVDQHGEIWDFTSSDVLVKIGAL